MNWTNKAQFIQQQVIFFRDPIAYFWVFSRIISGALVYWWGN